MPTLPTRPALTFSRRRLIQIAPVGVLGLATPYIVRADTPDFSARRFNLPSVLCPEDECGWVYRVSQGDPAAGIPPGVAFPDLPEDWICPNCGLHKAAW